MTDMKLIIDPEFKTKIRRLSHEEYRGLEESILEEGCRDPLVVWGTRLWMVITATRLYET